MIQYIVELKLKDSNEESTFQAKCLSFFFCTFFFCIFAFQAVYSEISPFYLSPCIATTITKFAFVFNYSHIFVFFYIYTSYAFPFFFIMLHESCTCYVFDKKPM